MDKNFSSVVEPSTRDKPISIRPVLTFAAVTLPAGWLLLGVPLSLGLPLWPFVLAVTFLVMLPAALLLSRDDPVAGPRALLADAVRMPGPTVWGLVALLAVPTLTWALAVPAGAAAPLNVGLVLSLAFNVASSVLVLNLWEELVWAGFVQRRAMGSWGLVPGSLLTALLFAGIHLPLAFADAPRAGMVLLNVAALLAAAVGLRLMVATVDLRSGGSLLAVAVLHASFNASAQLLEADADWLRYTAVVLLGTGLVKVGLDRRYR